LRALVTGGAGFIGAHVVKGLLERGADVRVMDNLSTGDRSNLPRDIEFLEHDIRDAYAVLRAAGGRDIIFHMAASVGNTRSIHNPWQDATSNIIGTLNVLEAARATNCQKVVYSSSAAIFGDSTEFPISASHATNPTSPYGVSKLAGEQYVLTFARLHGFDGICLRYFNVFGELQRFDPYGNVIPIFAKRILRDEPLTIYGDGNQTRDFIDVRDVALANLLAASTDGTSGSFNVGSGVAITILGLAQTMSNLAGRALQIVHHPPRPGDVRHSVADIKPTTQIFGFRPLQVFEASLRRYLAWLEAEPAPTADK
jgi:UDP-glucose 4-epimerase